MKYCPECGTALIIKTHEHEGAIPYCEHCQRFVFPVFNTAVSLIALSPDEKQILLISQYDTSRKILVAGYINQKESAEEAMYREMKEEIGLDIDAYRFMKSEYFEKTNTLMLNFAVRLSDTSLEKVSDWEIDDAQWYSFQEARDVIAPNSLAQRFLINFLNTYEQAKVSFFDEN